MNSVSHLSIPSPQKSEGYRPKSKWRISLESNTHRPLLRCLALYLTMPGKFALTAGLFLIVNLSLAWQQWLIGRAIHDVEQGVAVTRQYDGSLDYHVALNWMFVLLAVALVRGLFQYFAGVLSLIIGQGLLFTLRERILLQVQRLDLAYHLQHGIGEIVTRTTRDADKVRDALINFWRQVFETSLIVIATLGLLFWYHPLLGIGPLLLTAAGIALLLKQTDTLVQLDRAVGQAYDVVNQDLTEGIHGVRVIKAFSLEQSRISRFDIQVKHFIEHALKALAFSSSRIPLPQCVVALSHVWVLGFGAYLVSTSQLNLGELIAAMLIINVLVFRIEAVGRVMQVFADARSSATRIWELLDARPQISSGQQPVPHGALGIRLKKVRVTVPHGETDILRDLNLTLQPGEVVALVGATGSGKSTLASLLPRLVDVNDGEVAIGSDKLGWHPIHTLHLDQLRQRIHVVPQESFLFSDTLRNNLLLAKPDASDADLYAAIRLAAADDVLSNLPQGLDTPLGDRGVTLSGGQRQRLNLARALLSKPAILGLDDATSALDALTERRVIDNIRRLQQQTGETTTVLVIASKLSTILLADRVVVLAASRIVAQGTHADLAANNVAYRDLMGLTHDD